MLSPATKEQIRAASDIVDVIGGYLPLKRAGANFVTLCPFHREKTPSFNVNPNRQIFHCFGCQKGGDVFRFVQEYENVPFMEAVRRLAQRANIPLEFDDSPGGQQVRYVKETLLQIHEQITQRWQAALNNDAAGQIARDYLRQRGVPDEAVQLFRLGYAPELWDDTVNWARNKGFDLALVEQAGLIIRKQDTDKYYDRFRGRLMFPICDEQGRVIAFSGRVLSGDEKTAKYVNSPETPIFTKGKVFYGLDKSKRPILDAGFAIICEGQLDLIACYMAGVRNIVAPQGTAFTSEHARVLKRYVDEVVLCFDSDNAGQAATARVQDSLLTSGMAIRVAIIPSPHDPDSFIKEHGGAAFQERIAQAQEFFDFFLNHLCRLHTPSTNKGQIAVVQGMAEMVKRTRDTVLIDKYAQLTAMKLAMFMQVPISPDAVRTEFKKNMEAKREPHREPEGNPEESPGKIVISARDFGLLKVLLESEEFVSWCYEHLDLEWIEHPIVKRIVAERFALHEKNSWENFPAFISIFEEPAIRDLITEVLVGGLVGQKDGMRHRLAPRVAAKTLEDAAREIKGQRDAYYTRRLAELTQSFLRPGLSVAEQIQINQQKAEIIRLKREPLKPRSAS